MSSKPTVSAYGKAVKWMTIGSPTRALEVILGTDKCIKICFEITETILIKINFFS